MKFKRILTPAASTIKKIMNEVLRRVGRTTVELGYVLKLITDFLDDDYQNYEYVGTKKSGNEKRFFSRSVLWWHLRRPLGSQYTLIKFLSFDFDCLLYKQKLLC